MSSHTHFQRLCSQLMLRGNCSATCSAMPAKAIASYNGPSKLCLGGVFPTGLLTADS
jgi:hypothetical protein